MAISASQKKQLEAAGYTVSGNSVKNKDGGSVGGINENGKVWGGSSKVSSILKGSGKAAEAPKARPATKAPIKPRTAPKTSAPAASKKPLSRGAASQMSEAGRKARNYGIANNVGNAGVALRNNIARSTMKDGGSAQTALKAAGYKPGKSVGNETAKMPRMSPAVKEATKDFKGGQAALKAAGYNGGSSVRDAIKAAKAEEARKKALQKRNGK